MLRPSEDQIKKVMQETGMDYLQAFQHMKQRLQLQAQMSRSPQRSLGKSCYEA